MGLFVDQHLVVVLVAAHDQRMRPAVAQVVRHVEDRTRHHLLRRYRRLDADLGFDGAVQAHARLGKLALGAVGIPVRAELERFDLVADFFAQHPLIVLQHPLRHASVVLITGKALSQALARRAAEGDRLVEVDGLVQASRDRLDLLAVALAGLRGQLCLHPLDIPRRLGKLQLLGGKVPLHRLDPLPCGILFIGAALVLLEKRIEARAIAALGEEILDFQADQLLGIRRLQGRGALSALLDPQGVFELLFFRQNRIELGELRRQLLRLVRCRLLRATAGRAGLSDRLRGAVRLGITAANRQDHHQRAKTASSCQQRPRTAEQPISRTGNVIFHNHSPVLCLVLVFLVIRFGPVMA